MPDDKWQMIDSEFSIFAICHLPSGMLKPRPSSHHPHPRSPHVASRRNAFSMDHPIILTFLIIAIVASMSLAAEVLKPLALAILLSFALAPIARRLERFGLPRALAVILTVVTVLAGLGGVGFVVGRQLTQLANELPEDEKNIINKVSFLQPN